MTSVRQLQRRLPSSPRISFRQIVPGTGGVDGAVSLPAAEEEEEKRKQGRLGRGWENMASLLMAKNARKCSLIECLWNLFVSTAAEDAAMATVLIPDCRII